MKPTKTLCAILALILLAAPIVALQTKAAYVPGSNPAYVISFSQTNPYVPTLTLSIVPTTFNVSIWVVNCTATDVPAGISSIEVHIDFSPILTYCTPIAFYDMLGMPGPLNALNNTAHASLLYGIPAGFYDNTDALVSGPPYPGAERYEVAASTGVAAWFGDKGLVAIMTFTATGQPTTGNPDFTGTIGFQGTFTSLVDWDSNDVDFDEFTAELTIEAASAEPYPLPAYLPKVYFDSSTYHGASPVGSTFNVTVMLGNDHDSITGVAPGWDVAGFDVQITWDNALINFVAGSQGDWADGDTSQGLSGGSFTDGFAVSPGALEGVFTKTSDDFPTTGIVSLLQLEFSVASIPTVPVASPIAFVRNFTLGTYMPDLATWAHPERPNAPWSGSITAMDLGPGDGLRPGWFVIGSDALYYSPPMGAMIDLYTSNYPAPYNGEGPNVHSDAFAPQTLVCLKAKVTYNGYPVANKLVSFEIFDALGDKITILQNCTDNDYGERGVATVCFRIPQGDDNFNNTEDPAIFGWWLAVATVEIDGVAVNDTMPYQVGWLIQVMSVLPIGAPYTIPGPMSFVLTVRVISEQARDVILSVDAYDTQGYPIGEVAWSTILSTATPTSPSHSYDTWVFGPGGNATTGTIETDHLGGSIPDGPIDSSITMPIPTWVRVGIASVVGYALTNWPRLGGTPYGPQSPASTFTINSP